MNKLALLYGVLGGALYAVSGYLKSKEKFDKQKFLRTLVLGAIVGATNAMLGLPITEEAVLIALSAGEVAVIENFIKAVVKQYVK